MNPSSNLRADAAYVSAATATPRARRMVDAPTRVFHGLLAFSFVGAYLTAESERWRLVHVTLGYTMLGLLVFRLVWGVLGPRQARLAVLAGKMSGLTRWLRDAARGQLEWRVGQRLLLAGSVLAVLALIAPLTLSGFALEQNWAGDWLEEVHEVLGNAMLAVVLTHVAIIAALSLLRGRNLAGPMVSGRAPGPGPDLVKHNRAWLGMLLLAGAMTFWVWQWQQAPASEGGLDAVATGQAQSDRLSDEDD